jgi:predicted nucleotidyltransferase
MWKIVSENFKNACLIFPTQQKDVATLLKVAPLSKIKKVVIFGSSVTSACNPWSDLDVYIDFGTNPEQHFSTSTLENPVDLWSNYDVDDRLLHEINEKGVIVYGE